MDLTLNPRVAALKPSKTMALTDLATRLKEEGRDIIGLAAGEPDVSPPACLPAAVWEAQPSCSVDGGRCRQVPV